MPFEKLDGFIILILISPIKQWTGGQPPPAAVPFFTALYAALAEHANALGRSRFCVYALGDSEYADNFCKVGRDLESFMLDKGASKVCERVEEDASYRKEVRGQFALENCVSLWSVTRDG